MIDGRRHDPERNVRRIERVMAEWSGRIVGGRGAMHERYGPEGRFADRPTGQRESRRVVDGDPPHRRELHEQVMRMLAIDERPSVQRLASLKDLTITVLADRCRIETEHGVER